jgi:hypothetical protein
MIPDEERDKLSNQDKEIADSQADGEAAMEFEKTVLTATFQNTAELLTLSQERYKNDREFQEKVSHMLDGIWDMVAYIKRH